MVSKKNKKRSARRISIFNHKGGVGKTTLTANVAFALAELGKTVLLVDSDPQCNLSSYLLPEETVDKQLDESDSTKGRTVWSALKPVADGVGEVRVVKPFEPRANVFLIPGDIKLAEFETQLTESWAECFQRRVRGFRSVAALSSLITSLDLHASYDFVLYDSGPNIGGLNRSIVMDCDQLVIPAACDLFSIRALKTLGDALFRWIRDWQTIEAIAPDDVPMLGGQPRLGAYLPQRFKTYGGEYAANYSKMVARLERHVETDVLATIRPLEGALVADSPLRIGEVREFAGLVQAAQLGRTALWQTKVGTEERREDARRAFHDIANSLIEDS